jgi:glycosyltransferase involved in cell wall biosynthesis
VKQPLVTIVTPSYNQGHFIRATIESVLSQNYPHIEYIIMDGGSKDETAAVAAEYSSRLKFISEKDRGQSHAINKGFRMAQGEVISWLNSDDTILAGAVEHAVCAFERRPELGAVYGEGYQIDYDGAIKCRFPATEPFNLWKLVYLSDYVLQQTLYFRKQVIEELGYIDESLHWGMDWDILIRIGKRYAMEYVPEYMGCLREYGEAKSFSGGHKRFRELAMILRRHGDLRYPPGYFTYGLDTYQKLLCDWIPSSKLRKVIGYATHVLIARIIREAQGLYSDGWASTRLMYMLPAGRGTIRISGMLPDLGAPLKDQRLTVKCEGKIVKEELIPFGEFNVTIPCQSENRAPILEILASRFIVSAKAGIGGDRRKLAYMLRTIDWTANSTRCGE